MNGEEGDINKVQNSKTGYILYEVFTVHNRTGGPEEVFIYRSSKFLKVTSISQRWQDRSVRIGPYRSFCLSAIRDLGDIPYLQR